MPDAATTPTSRIELDAAAPAACFALPNYPAAEAAPAVVSAAAGARAAAAGASHTQLQYASTTASNAIAAKFAAEAVLFDMGDARARGSPCMCGAAQPGFLQ